MGMTIEDIEQWARQNNYTIVADNWWEAAQDRINKYQQLQADYENRLKADKELETILDKIKTDIAKFADTIPFVSGDIKAKHANIGQHDGLEQALEIIEGNIKGDFDIDEWMAENE